MKVYQLYLLCGAMQFVVHICQAFTEPVGMIEQRRHSLLEYSNLNPQKKMYSKMIGKGLPKYSITGPLLYRIHDEEDDDSSMFVLNKRTAPSFNKTDVTPTIKTSEGGVNKPLLILLFINQFVILGLSLSLTTVYLFISEDLQFLFDGILNWSGQINTNSLDVWMVPIRILEGICASIPMILFGSKLENSEDRNLARANFSTVFMVMTLFGRRSQISSSIEKKQKTDLKRLKPLTKWSDVALLSAGISSVTAFCEECSFRGMIPHVMSSSIFGGSIPLTMLGQATLFGLGHASLSASKGENIVVPSIQFMNGLWLGFVYISTNGDILPCIIAHALYDFEILFFTWMKANDQIEYAYYKCLDPIPADSVMEVNALKREFKIQVDDHIFDMFKKVFFIMDTDKNGTISKSEVQRGISYLDIEGILVAPSQKLVNSVFDQCISIRSSEKIAVDSSIAEELRFSDFIRLLLTVKVMGDKVKPKRK